MKIEMFHLMPYRELPRDFDERYRSVWVDPPVSLIDAVAVNRMYNETLDELEYAAAAGFDGICVNEHHENAYGLMPSPNLMAAALARRTRDAALIVLGNSIALYNPPVRVAEEFAMLDCIPGGGSIETWRWTLEKHYLYAYLSYAGFKRGQRVMDGFWRTAAELGLPPNPYHAGFLQLVAVGETESEVSDKFGPHAEYFYN